MAGRAYTEADEPHPMGAYASFEIGRRAVRARAYLDHPLIVRTSGVFGPGGLDTARGNFVESMLRLAAQGQTIRMVEDHVASPTYAPALASRVADLVAQKITGLIHAGGGTPISWFDWAAKIFEAAGLHPVLKPTNERGFRTAARRPRYSALSNAKLESLGIPPMPRLEDAIREYLKARTAKVHSCSSTF